MKKITGLKRVYVIMMAIFAILTMTLFIYLNELYRNELEDERKSIQAQADSFAANLEARLTAIDEQLLETSSRVLTLDLDNQTDSVRLSNRKSVSDSFLQQTSYVDNLDCIFLMSADKSFTIRAVNPQMLVPDRAELIYFFAEEEPEYSNLADRSWMLLKLTNSSWFYKAYRIDGYLVGAFSKIDNYHFDLLQRKYTWKIEKEDICFYENDTNTENGKVLVNSGHLVEFCEPLEICGGILKISVLNDKWNRYLKSLVTGTLILWLICIGAEVFLIHTFRERITKPIQELLNATRTIQKGDYTFQIKESGDPEFLILKRSMNQMVRTIVNLRIDQYEKKVQLQEQELKLLRQQLKPHFYLNAITVIKGMTYQNENEKIREYIMALNAHIRYMLKNEGGISTVREEFEHLNRYLDMQKIKFPDEIVSYVYWDKSLGDQKVPHLMLYTIVENAFKYAMGYQMPLTVFVQCEAERKNYKGIELEGMSVEYEDNGPGFPAEVVEKFAQKIYDASSGSSVGLTNLEKTLHLLYDGKAEMKLENSELHGARILIWIPWERGKMHENTGCR